MLQTGSREHALRGFGRQGRLDPGHGDDVHPQPEFALPHPPGHWLHDMRLRHDPPGLLPGLGDLARGGHGHEVTYLRRGWDMGVGQTGSTPGRESLAAGVLQLFGRDDKPK